jgi:hypothetical protein
MRRSIFFGDGLATNHTPHSTASASSHQRRRIGLRAGGCAASGGRGTSWRGGWPGAACAAAPLPLWPNAFALGAAAGFGCAGAGGTGAPIRGAAADAGGAADAISGGASDQPDIAAAALAPAAAVAAADTGAAAGAPARACAVPHQGQKFTGLGVGLPQAALMQR